MVEAWLLDALTVEDPVQRVAPKSLSVTQDQGCSGPWNNARAKIGIGFGAPAEIQRNAAMRPVAEIQKSRLIVPASVRDIDERKESVFDFVLIACGDAEVRKQIARLSARVSAVILKPAVTVHRVVVVLASVRFPGADLRAPVPASGKNPPGAGAENMLKISLAQVGRFERGLSGDPCDAVVVAQHQAELIGVTEGVAEIAGEGAIQKIIVRSLAVGLQVGCGGGIVARAEQAAELCSAATRGKSATFTKDGELRNARGAAVGEELDDAGNRIGAVDGAFGPVNDFHFIDVVQGEIGKIDGTAGRIDGRAINEHFGEIGISAVEENGRGPAFGTCPANRDARHV